MSTVFNWQRFLIVHGMDAEKWAKRYDLEPFSHSCSKCGVMLTTTLPIALGQLRGLMAPRCDCGNQESPVYVVVRDPRFGDLLSRDGW